MKHPLKSPIARLAATCALISAGTLPASAAEFCDRETELRSLNSEFETSLEFRNLADSAEEARNIYWLDFEGKRVLYRTLFPGEVFGVTTYLTHPWVVTAPMPGGSEICLAMYMPDPTRRIVDLR